MKNKRVWAMSIFVTLLAMSLPLKAIPLVWDFSYTGINSINNQTISVSGTLTTSDVLVSGIGAFTNPNLSGYQIIGITGQRNGQAITGLVNNPSFPSPTTVSYVTFDNGLLTEPLGFDNYGLYYLVGLNPYNLCSVDFPAGGGYMEIDRIMYHSNPVSLTISPNSGSIVSPVPDMACTIPLIWFGIVGFLGFKKMTDRHQVHPVGTFA